MKLTENEAMTDDDYGFLLRLVANLEKIESGVTQTSADGLFSKTRDRKMTISDAREIVRLMLPKFRKIVNSLAVHNAGAQENVITQEPFALWYRVKDAQHMPEGSLHPYSVNLQWCCQNERTDLAEVVALYRGPLPDISDYLDRFGNPKADYKLKLAQPQPMTVTAHGEKPIGYVVEYGGVIRWHWAFETQAGAEGYIDSLHYNTAPAQRKPYRIIPLAEVKRV